jgi:septal ring factor EnvC (AmiA/AmiB activator)
MGFMDKVKTAAQEVAVEAKKMGAQAQGMLSEAQLKRKMDDCAKRLGYLTHQERTRGSEPGAEAERLGLEISGLETQIAQAAAEAKIKQASAQAQAPQPSSSPTSTTEPPPPPPQGSP